MDQKDIEQLKAELDQIQNDPTQKAYTASEMAIKGILELSVDQEMHMFRVNDRHKACVGTDYKDGLTITEVCLDENQTVCVRVKNSEWYHYYSDGSWG